jgi:hypothetical protein
MLRETLEPFEEGDFLGHGQIPAANALKRHKNALFSSLALATKHFHRRGP